MKMLLCLAFITIGCGTQPPLLVPEKGWDVAHFNPLIDPDVDVLGRPIIECDPGDLNDYFYIGKDGIVGRSNHSCDDAYRDWIRTPVRPVPRSIA